MAIFQNKPKEWQRLDWSILQNGPISLYWKTQVLENDLSWFKEEKYTLVDFDCSTWVDDNEMHKQLKQNLNFPDYYGENFDALNDCLSDIEIFDTGQIIIFRHFDKFDKKLANILLDVFATNSRRQILLGNRIIVLIQVDNSNYQIDPVGATPVIWNAAEWLIEKRS